MAVDADTTPAHRPETDRPNRLHHAAWFTLDSEATRHFYEDVLGIPLVATWCERGGDVEYVHTFFAMRDGGALAFFQYADPNAGPVEPRTPGHLAFECSKQTQDALVARLEASGISAEINDHGYCRSLYVKDPNNLLLEFTVDHADIARINEQQRAHCHEDLARWLAGDRTPNNEIRPH